jgi:hypothetical protein
MVDPGEGGGRLEMPQPPVPGARNGHSRHCALRKTAELDLDHAGSEPESSS